MKKLFLITLLLICSPVSAATFSVNSTLDTVDANIGDGICATSQGACTLRAAIQEANATLVADTITLPDGHYSINISGGDDLSAVGDFDITQALTINGTSKAGTIIDGNSSYRLFHITANVAVSLSNLSIVNGQASSENGGGILSAATSAPLTLTALAFKYNQAQNGGAISSSGPLSMSSSDFEANRATTAGGALNLSGTGGVTISASNFTNSIADGGAGGAILYTGAVPADSDIVISNSIFSDNRADTTQSGGSIMINNAAGDLTLSSTDISSSSGLNGGCLYFRSTGTLTISGSQFNNCRAFSRGGAIYSNRSGAIAISSSTFTENVASTFGGAMFFTPDSTPALTLSNLTVTDNLSQTTSAGGIYVEYPSSPGGVVIADRLNVRRNTCYGGGCGALFYNYTDLTIQSSVFDSNLGLASLNNFFNVLGGGVYMGSNLASTTLIRSSTFSSNHITNGFGAGLGVDGNANSVTVEKSTFSANIVDYLSIAQGGGILSSAATLVLKNCTFAGNSADRGGGLHTTSATTVNNCTFSGNSGLTSSADIYKTAALTISNSILANSQTSSSCGVALTSGGHNLNEDNSCGLSASGDTNGSDPMLSALTDFAGVTPTFAFLGSSSAIDSGDNATCEATDQLDTARPVDGDGNGSAVCDIGSIENTDLCPADSNKTAPGTCGCGVADLDANSNGIADCLVNDETVSALQVLSAAINKFYAPGRQSAAKYKKAAAKVRAKLAILKAWVTAHGAEITLLNQSKTVNALTGGVNSRTKSLLTASSKTFAAAKVQAIKSIRTFRRAITGV